MLQSPSSLTTLGLGLGLLAAHVSATAQTTVIDFSGLSHEEVVTTQVPGVTISGFNPNRDFDTVIGWDYLARPDLAPFGHYGPAISGGNVGSGADLGKGVSLKGVNSSGLEGNRPAGQITFEFDQAIDSFQFTITDVEGPVEFETASGYFLDFEFEGEDLGRVFFGDLITPGSVFYDPTREFGNGTANRIGPFVASDFGADQFDTVYISLGGSAVISQITTQLAGGQVVPTPGAVAGGLGLMTLIAARRRRQQLEA